MKSELDVVRGNGRGFLAHYAVPALTALLFLALFGLSIYRYLYQARNATDQVIIEHIGLLSDVLHRIDNQCNIIGFEHQKNRINFLTVKKFVGSEIGSMNLMLPENWQGPYLKDNPTVQEKIYLVVRTNKGYFITPGEGVRLGNGKVVGKDIPLDEAADIEAMMYDESMLNSHGYPLAAPLNFKDSSLEKLMQENILRAQADITIQDVKRS